MDTETYNYDDERIRPIKKIDFGILGNDEVLRASALDKDSGGIEIPDLYDNLEPKRGGLIDPRLGTTDNHIDCATCGLGTETCVGHSGHITLAEPVFHAGYIHYVKKILSCVCLKCSKLLVYKNEDEIEEMLKNKSGRARLAEIRNIVKNVTHCQKQNEGCGAPVAKVKLIIKKSTLVISMQAEISNVPSEDGGEGKKKIIQTLTPEDCYAILKNIKDKDCKIMGIDPAKSRPEDMIYKIFPVPPVPMRPSAKADFLASSTMEDDLTHKLADIVKANLRMIRHKESLNENTAKYGQDHMHLLQYHVVSYFDNENLPVPKSVQKGRDLVTLATRLKGKEGRIRGNLMGKRVNFSARTVITPDPTIDINQLGVPIKIATELTFPEIVTPQNIDKMTKLVKNGRDIYPGANFVFPASSLIPGQRIMPLDLRFRKEKIELRYGDIVERHLVDGDIVLLNRQPTLHKQSMMGHRIKVIQDENLSTFRLSVAVCTPYNADFDGDEMNIFIPQSIQTQIELEEIADVKRQLITPGTSKTIIGLVQDGLIGGYCLTSPSMRIDWKSAMNIMSYTSIDDYTQFKKQDYTGHELFSMIIPPKINVNKFDDEKKPLLVIKNGKLEAGYLTNDSLGSKKKNNLTQLIWDEYGIEEAKKFLDNTQRLLNNFNLFNGFSVNIGDILYTPELEKEINKILETKKLKVSYLVTEVENNPDLMDEDLYNRIIQSELDTVLGEVSKLLMNNFDPLNGLKVMLNSGSKGDPTKIGQMAGCFGNNTLEGKLIPKKMNKRTLPYFFQNDDTALSRGLVEESFLTGLEFPQFIFHNMSSREGLVDTAIKTAESGYIQRKLVKSMEDAVVKYDCTVRTANDSIIQYIYGDSGTDTTKQYEQTIKMIEYSDKQMEDKFKFTKDELENFNNFAESDNEKHLEEMIDFRNLLREIQFKSKMNYRVTSGNFMSPVNIVRIIENIKHSKSNNDTTSKILEPKYVIEQIEEALSHKNTNLLTMTKKNSENPEYIKQRDEQLAKTMLRIALYDHLAPKRSIIDHKLTKAKFDEIIKELIRSYNKSLVEPGEMVGLIAAQSIGEPTTQMSLPYHINVRIGGKYDFVGPIGKFIDNLFETKGTIKNMNFVGGKNDDSIVMDLEDDYYIIGVSNDEKTSWKRISQISRHPVNGKLVKIYTQSGRDITATLSHSFLKRTIKGIAPIKGSELKINDRIPISRIVPEIKNPLKTVMIGNESVKLNKEFGWFIGAYLSDGWISGCTISVTKIENEFLKNIDKIAILFGEQIKTRDSESYIYNKGPYKSRVMSFVHKDLAKFIDENFSHGSYDKKIGSMVFSSNLDFISGIISGYFDGDGNINAMRQSIRNGSRSKQLIEDMCVLLSYFGIFTSQLEETSKNIPGKILYTVQVHKKYARLFKEKIGLQVKYKAEALDKIIEYNERNNKHAVKEEIDEIPEINPIIAEIGSKLKLPGQSRLYKRWLKKSAIGRRTLDKYIQVFTEANNKSLDPLRKEINEKINILKSARDADVVWDKIIKIEYIEPENENEYVYDFTVPGNDSFACGNGVLVHNTLNTFHSSGIAAMAATTLGVPRIKELIGLSKNIKTPKTLIYLTKDYMSNRGMANKIASHIRFTTIEHIRSKIDVYYDPNPNKKGGFMEKDNVTEVFYTKGHTKTSCQSDYKGLPWLMRIELDKEKMMNKEVTILDIVSKFCNAWEKRFLDLKSSKKEEVQVLKKITHFAVLHNTDNDFVPVVHIRFDMIDFELNTINDFITILVEKFKLKGISGINNIDAMEEERMISFDNDTHEMEKKSNFVIYTAGINMYDIRYIHGIDLNKTICNDVTTAYETFGIEAARNTLLYELKTVYGEKINYHHLSLLVDIMTLKGVLTSIDRHGMSRSDADPLAIASFERPVDQLLTAAIFGESDNMRGISSRLMAGLVINGGTGMCKTYLDTDILENAEHTENTGEKYKNTYNEIGKNTIIKDVLEKEKSDIFMPS